MAEHLLKVFRESEKRGRAAFVGFVTAGYPSLDETVDVMIGMERGGTDIIELGVPFTDPLADGATIQKTNEVALTGGAPVSLTDCLARTKAARAKGLTAPVILMGYYNPFLAFGLDALMKASVESGVNGFIVVDLPPEEGAEFVKLCSEHGLSYVPLLTPTSTDERIKHLASVASSFCYCVSLTGVTGAREDLPKELPDFIARVRQHTSLPLAVGFGISTPKQVEQVGEFADGVVVGSAICKALDAATAKVTAAASVEAFIKTLTATPGDRSKRRKISQAAAIAAPTPALASASEAHFGEFGGRYVPETLVEAHRELEEQYAAAKADPAFQAQIDEMRKQCAAQFGGAQFGGRAIRRAILFGRNL